jgi:hypothetical protein
MAGENEGAMRSKWLVVIALGGAIFLVFSLVVLPPYVVSISSDGTKLLPVDRIRLENDVRSTLLQGIAGLAVLVAAYLIWRQLQVRYSSDYNLLSKEIASRTSELSDRGEGLLLMEKYHAQGLAQSSISFWFGLLLAALGFAVILGAIALAVNSRAAFNQQGRATITLIAGTITEAVSILFFNQSNKARELMKDFFDKLRSDERMKEAMKLTKEISEINLRSGVQAVLALRFVDSRILPSVLPGFPEKIGTVNLSTSTVLEEVIDGSSDRRGRSRRGTGTRGKQPSVEATANTKQTGQAQSASGTPENS